MPGKFFCTFHIKNVELSYSLRRLKELLSIYIEMVNGERSDQDPKDIQELDAAITNLSSRESAYPLISIERKKIKGIDGNEKELLQIMLVGNKKDVPFCIIDWQD